MIGIIKYFGWLAILSAIGVLAWCIRSPETIVLYPLTLPLAFGSLFGGALLVALARVVRLLQDINEQVVPISRIARGIEHKYESRD